ncbi:hypothetical protein EMIT0P4_10172 [Pseudomonas sp. IT-P4]
MGNSRREVLAAAKKQGWVSDLSVFWIDASHSKSAVTEVSQKHIATSDHPQESSAPNELLSQSPLPLLVARQEARYCVRMTSY